MRAHLTPQAEIDLEEVGDYIALDNPRRAVSFIREIRQHCEKIADGPHHYAARPWRRLSGSELGLSGSIAFYRPSGVRPHQR
jgi:plasmid stabilization system protein ParE